MKCDICSPQANRQRRHCSIALLRCSNPTSRQPTSSKQSAKFKAQMASSDRSPSPSRRQASSAVNNDGDLAQSLKQLSLTTSSPAAAQSPRSIKPAVDRSPSTPRPGSAALRSHPNGVSPGNNGAQSYSRSATPNLLRKASQNSLHNSSAGAVPQRRASSANVAAMPAMPRSPLRGVSTSPPDRVEPLEPEPAQPAHTAASIASDFFKRELSMRHGASSNTGDTRSATETVVILQDDCYGHRYSRPRTSRAALSTIVERPERIKATVLGVSAAYVRLGERHAEGRHGLHPQLDPASIPNIPFRIHKTSRRLPLTSQTVTNVHGTKWMEELKIMCDSAEARLAMNGKELQRPEMQRGPEQEAPQKFHEGDLYLCAESLAALEGALGGVCEAVDAVFDERGASKRAFVAIRPPGHHCSASYPSGFCWINNVHVGIMHAILSHGLTHAAIIDFDLHHGDGSQQVAWQHNARSVGLAKNASLWKKTSIGYFSLHDINSYPCEMGDEEKVKNASLCIENAHGQNIWNVHLQPWRSEAEFWKLYETKYAVLLDKTRTYLHSQTERLKGSGLKSKAAIFLSAGLDASEWESAGMQRHNVNVPTDFYARFSRDVVRIAAEEGTSVEGRIISVLEGGYSDRALYSGVLSHICGLAGDDPVVRDQEYNGLGYEMGQRMGTTVRGRKDSSASERGTRPYEPSWWSLPELEKIEAMSAPPAPVPETRKPRNSSPATYSSPTHASSARAVAVPKSRRSMSGLSAVYVNSSPRGPTPPPPEVPWTVAAHELSKLLIPSDRQTGSCTHEDLAAEATRARQARQSALAQSASAPGTPLGRQGAQRVPAPDPVPTRMALRERKAKASVALEEDVERKNRRKTVAGPVLSVEKEPETSKSTRAPSRRLSAASTVVSHDLTDDTPTTKAVPTATGRGVSFRPDASENSRPDTSRSVRTTSAAPVPLKKTRVVGSNLVKKEAVPRQPRTQKKSPTTEAANPITSASSSTAGRTVSGRASTAASARSSQAGDDMDRLTGDMKKIKITVLSKVQKEARERERLEREKAAQMGAKPEAEARPSDSVAVTKPDAAVPAPVPMHSQDSEPNSAQQSSSPSLPVAPPAAAPLLPAPPLLQQSQSSISDLFVPYQPEGPTPLPAVAQQQQPPLQWLPPNASTPAAMEHANLPVFTSTSAIPFALRPERNAVVPAVKTEQGTGVDEKVWDVPDTPMR